MKLTKRWKFLIAFLTVIFLGLVTVLIVQNVARYRAQQGVLPVKVSADAALCSQSVIRYYDVDTTLDDDAGDMLSSTTGHMKLGIPIAYWLYSCMPEFVDVTDAHGGIHHIVFSRPSDESCSEDPQREGVFACVR
jgi:hypothetical protein